MMPLNDMRLISALAAISTATCGCRVAVSAFGTMKFLSPLEISYRQFHRPTVTKETMGFSVLSPVRLFGSPPDLGDSTDTSEESSVVLSSKQEAVEKSRLFREEANRARLEAERMEAELALKKIEKLQRALQSAAGDAIKREDIQRQIERMVSKMDPTFHLPPSTIASKPASSLQSKSPPVETNTASAKKALTDEEMKNATTFFISLPAPMRKALAAAVTLDEHSDSPTTIVYAIFERGDSLDASHLQQVYNSILARVQAGNSLVADSKNLEQPRDSNENNLFFDKMGALFDQDPQQMQLDRMIESILPRVTRKEGKGPTEADISLFVSQVLSKDTFLPSEAPQKIEEGYVIRGNINTVKIKNPTALVEAIDAAIDERAPKEWSEKFQFCYIYDPTPRSMDDFDKINGDPVLLVTCKDMAPTASRFFLSLVSAGSLFGAFVFSIATYSSNDVVMQRLTDANAMGRFDLEWFNALLAPILFALGVSQACHEVGHLLVAWKDKIKMSPPTILPIVSLPYLTFQSKLKNSPKDFMSLFNFAFAGPAVGMVASLGFLLIGLQMTLDMDSQALQYAPALPLSFLKLSSLGATVVDTVLGGGDGAIFNQDPSTTVKLHPFAIGGLASLMINALDVIPTGSTDGGRLATSLLGRSGQLVFSSFVFFGLLLYTVFSGQRDIFLAYCLINSFAQRDLEVPCRNEIDGVGLTQAAAALLVWSIAILTLVPLH